MRVSFRSELTAHAVLTAYQDFLATLFFDTDLSSFPVNPGIILHQPALAVTEGATRCSANLNATGIIDIVIVNKFFQKCVDNLQNLLYNCDNNVYVL